MNKNTMASVGQCSSAYAPITCIRITWMLAKHRVLWRVLCSTVSYSASGLCISETTRWFWGILKFENQWFVLTVLLQVQLSLLENSGITRKIKLLLQCERQCDTNSNEIAMPFLDQNVLPFSVEKDSHIVKALIFVTDAVPCCFHWFL